MFANRERSREIGAQIEETRSAQGIVPAFPNVSSGLAAKAVGLPLAAVTGPSTSHFQLMSVIQNYAMVLLETRGFTTKLVLPLHEAATVLVLVFYSNQLPEFDILIASSYDFLSRGTQEGS